MAIETPRKIWDFFAPPDPPLTALYPTADSEILKIVEPHVKRVQGWRVKVSWTLAIIVSGAVWAGSPFGFVRAGDLKQRIDNSVREAVSVAVKDIKDEQVDMAQKLNAIEERGERQDTALREILRGQLANNICRLVNRRAQEVTPGEKANLRADIDEEQEKYKTIVGEYYQESRCGP